MSAPAKFSGRIGDIIPNVYVETTKGDFNLHDYFKDSWGIIFSHPRDFTPVCTTELSEVQRFMPEFTKVSIRLLLHIYLTLLLMAKTIVMRAFRGMLKC